ncbi:FAD-dependent oxidoreductase [Sphaerisporangium perillae]|uniref:FAD-dependent oxidoreductase n=1 Tax=Sphaerisporangium perillae TaxID=2935860 RepID=UPI00200F921F|nr:FAD-dependent monooxygenase [Sphaerisporangium perillae]
MNKVKTALVIGGGVAGPVAGMALRRAGIEATVYEAYPTTADGVGGSLGIAPNGLAALRAIDAEDAVLAVARPMPGMVMTVGRRRLGEVPALPGLPPLQLVWRADLHRALHDRAVAQGVRIEHGKRLVGVEETASGITARFTDGGTATADILIGADGIRSTVRTLIDPDAPSPRHTGLLGFEAIADFDVPEDPATMIYAFGRRGYYLYRPHPGGGTEWGANLPQDRPLTLAEARRIPAAEWLRTLREAYADDDPGADLVRHTSPDRLHVLGSLHIMPSLPHWHRGRMALVGDAAHAPSNSSGQGASLAIESAVQIARCLRDLPDAESAFATYERLRRPRVEKVAARAARINHAKAPGPLTRAVMPLLMPIMMKTVMAPEKSVGPEQRYVIDWDEPVTARP